MTKVEGTPFILVVDGDDEVVNDELASLRQAGWTALGTTDPWQALQLIAEPSLSLIVLDLDLPGLGGSDLRTMIQDDPGLKDVPVIFLSAHAAELGPRLEFFFGQLPCLAKPFNASLLVSTTRRLLAGAAAPNEVQAPESASRSGTRFVRRHRDPVSFERSA